MSSKRKSPGGTDSAGPEALSRRQREGGEGRDSRGEALRGTRQSQGTSQNMSSVWLRQQAFWAASPRLLGLVWAPKGRCRRTIPHICPALSSPPARAPVSPNSLLHGMFQRHPQGEEGQGDTVAASLSPPQTNWTESRSPLPHRGQGSLSGWRVCECPNAEPVPQVWLCPCFKHTLPSWQWLPGPWEQPLGHWQGG